MINFTSHEKETIGALIIKMMNDKNISQAKFARTMDLNPADISNLINEKWKENPSLIGDPKWIKLARLVNYDRRKTYIWKAARTDVYNYMTSQMSLIQQESLTGMLVDDAGIGKTFTAIDYAIRNHSAFYIDCCANASKQSFIRAIGQAVGVGRNGKINDILEESIYALSQMETPLLIFDEGGDLEHNAFLILKRIYNALKGSCGFYIIGADGMKKKIQNGIMNNKLGFVEIYSRFGRKFGRVTPTVVDEKRAAYLVMAKEIAMANGLNDEEIKKVQKVVTANRELNDMRAVEKAIKGILRLKK